MNAQNLTFEASSNLEYEQPTTDYLSWLNSISNRAAELQTECIGVLNSVTESESESEPGQGGTRGPWLTSVNESLNALIQGSLAGAILAANAEQI